MRAPRARGVFRCDHCHDQCPRSAPNQRWCKKPECRRAALLVRYQASERAYVRRKANAPPTKSHAKPGPEGGLASPNVCGLPIRGGSCQRALLNLWDRDGRGVIECPVHGRRVAPVVRPPNFVRYDQRERLEREIGGLIGRAQRPVDERMSERSTRIRASRGGRNDITVVGRDLANRIEAA